MKHNLCIDLGNTLCKVGLFQKDSVRPIATYQCTIDNFSSLLQDINAKYVIGNAILSSVVDDTDAIANMLAENSAFFMVLNKDSRLPFINAYGSADTLGSDRLALAAGALALYPDKASLIIALGTCITYNFILANKFFRGGAISPGLQMRLKALHEYTDKLPLVKAEGDAPILGYDTDTSIRSGVVNGIVAEIESMCAHYSREMKDDFNPILTGGDMSFFEPRIKNKIFAAPEILLIGLNEILKHNVPLY